MEKRWTEQYIINSHDTDYNGAARASNLLRYHQETAHRQLEGLGPSEKTLRERGQAFLLSRISMRLYAPLFEGDPLEVQTWGCESRAVSFFRCGQLRRNGVLVGELVSLWALMDVREGKLVRVSDALPDFPTDDVLDIGIPLKLRIPQEMQMKLTGEFTVGYGVTDRNRHMNNTFYPDLLCDYYPGGMKGRQVLSFSINYVNEAPLGETVKVYTSEADEEGVCYYRTVRSDGKTGIEASLRVDRLA